MKIGAILLLSAVLLLLTVSACAHAADPIYLELSTLATVDGKPTWIPCPKWDWSKVPAECRRPAFNCVPTCGKWPGDRIDIGAYEYVPGITPEKPWGIWAGEPLALSPGQKPAGGPEPPKQLRPAPPPAPFDLTIIGVKYGNKRD